MGKLIVGNQRLGALVSKRFSEFQEPVVTLGAVDQTAAGRG